MTGMVRPLLLDLAPYDTEGRAEAYAMDHWLDHLQTVGIALSQRRMTNDQRERLYGLLESIYADARHRGKERKRRAA